MENPNSPGIPDERLELLFRHAGMSEKEAKLYRLLLLLGESRASTLAKKSGIKRTNVYGLLQSMKANGLVTEFENGAIKYYRAESPTKLTEIIDSQEKRLRAAQDIAGDLIPNLTSQWKTSQNKPVIRYFEGENGVRNVLEDVYAPGKIEILGCVGLEHPESTLYDHIIKKLAPLRIRRNIFTRALNTDSPRARSLQENDRDRLSEIFLADPTLYPLPAEIDVYEDKIAFMSFPRKDFVGVIIENKEFATTLGSIFRLLFALLRVQS